MLPGYWMVFGINNAGVPSNAKILKIGNAAATTLAATRQSTLEIAAFAVVPAAPPVPMPPGTQLD
jgi:hypothetical protein